MFGKILSAVTLVLKYVDENKDELQKQFNDGKKLIEDIQALFKEEEVPPAEPVDPAARRSSSASQA